MRPEYHEYRKLGNYDPILISFNTYFTPEEIDNFLNPKLKIKYAYVGGTLFHEWTHLLQMVGTSFGRYYTHENFIKALFTVKFGEILIRDYLLPTKYSFNELLKNLILILLIKKGPKKQ